MPSLLSAEELLELIPNIILISKGNTLLVLVSFDLLYIFIELEVDLHIFSQLASTSMTPFLDREL